MTRPLPPAALTLAAVACGVACDVRAADVPLSVSPAVEAAQADRAATIARVAPTVVAIFGPDGGGGGSGVLISADGLAVTNFHVTDGCGDAMKCGLNDGRVYDAVVVGTDPVGDVALIKMLGRDDFPVAEMGDSDAVRPGDWCLAMGNPFLLAKADFTPTVTLGIVSGTHRYQEPAGTFLEYTDCLQVDASVNPGNSGGPLFAADGPQAGKLIGINGRISVKRGRVNSGAAYAISINQVRHFLGHLKSGRVLDHGTLNATVRTGFDGAVTFDRVAPGSAADRRGVREGDELVEFAGRPVRSVNQFKNVLGIYPAGWALPLTVRRGGETLDVLVRTRGLNRTTDLLRVVAPKPGPPPGEAVKGLIEKRPGFANAHFNDLETERLLSALPTDAPAGAWSLTGADADGVPAEFTVAPAGVALELGPNAFLQQLGGDAAVADEPPGSGGLLFALRQWQRLRTGATGEFGDFYHVGAEPLDWAGPTVDVLAAEDRGTRTHFYVQATADGSARLAGFDFWRTPEDAPCEVRFGGGTVGGGPSNSTLTIPAEMAVSSAGLPVRTIRFTGAESAPAAGGGAGGMSVRNLVFAGLLAAAPPFAPAVPAAAAEGVVAETLPKVVKIFGAGGLRGLPGYGTGFLISGRGHVATAWNHVLDADPVLVVLDDGRRLEYRVLAADPARGLAVLEPARDDLALPHFEPADAAAAEPGDRVLAFSNAYKVAGGDEPVGVQRAVVSAVAELDARRGGAAAGVTGPVLILDAATNNAGAAGGAVVDRSGRLVGILGRELKNDATNVFVNYALPAADAAGTLRAMLDGTFSAAPTASAAAVAGGPTAADLGVALVPDVVRRTPAYVDFVADGSPAAVAGVRPGDLVVLLGGELVPSIRLLTGRLAAAEPGSDLNLVVRRDGELVPLTVEIPVAEDLRDPPRTPAPRR